MNMTFIGLKTLRKTITMKSRLNKLNFMTYDRKILTTLYVQTTKSGSQT